MQCSGLCAIAITVALHGSALAKPETGQRISETPLGDVMKPSTLTVHSYGLCNGPPNADAFPMTPVPLVAGTCDDWQAYTATMPSTSVGCGGFTVAFGPKGDLKPYLDRVKLTAEWGDTPLTEAQCAKATLAAVAWGARCIHHGCASGEWEWIGSGPKQRSGGIWNSVLKNCHLRLDFVSTGKSYSTLNLDIIATLKEGTQTVRKSAKGTIYVSKPNGKCVTLPANPGVRK